MTPTREGTSTPRHLRLLFRSPCPTVDAKRTVSGGRRARPGDARTRPWHFGRPAIPRARARGCFAFASLALQVTQESYFFYLFL